MQEPQQLSEAALARETLKHLSEGKSVLRRAAHVLDRVAHSGVGLGEVLQDYAHQACGQLQGVLRAGENLSRGAMQPEDAESMENIHFILKAVKAVLEMTPAAMQRNKADELGGKDKLTRADVAAVTHDFLHSPDIARLLAKEDSGRIFAALTAEGQGSAGSPLPGLDPASAVRH